MGKLRDFHDNSLVLHPDPGSFTAEAGSTRWSNKDLDPVPNSQKKWEWYHVGGFWIAEGFSVAQMQAPSSAIALGLNPGLAMAACFIGNILVTGPCMSQAYIGSKFSINFPVLARASFGLWGSYVAMVVRGVVCVVWFGVQGSLGGTAVQCMINAIWPSFEAWHIDALPESSFITAPALLCFVIFWLATLPFLYLSIPALRWMFLVKICIMPFFGVALFTWALTAGHGVGPLFSIPNNITDGWTIGYAFCYTMTASISGNATFAINQSDITRYARNPRTSAWVQLMLPICITLTELLGTVMAASAQVVYGQVLWNPLTVVLLWDNRTAKFFAGLLFGFANIGTNVAGNSIPFANDLMGLFPKYINIRRGQFICAILGFAICPWLIEAKAASFLAFLNGYTVFLGPLVGVVMADFWLVRKGKGFNVYHLYKPHGLYWYTRGWNLIGLAAFMIGVVPQLPGLAYHINPELAGLDRGYLGFTTLSWLDGAIFSSVAYYTLFRIFPFPTQTDEEDKARHVVEGFNNSESDSLDGSLSHDHEKLDRAEASMKIV